MKAVFLTEAEADIKELRFYIIKRFGANTWRETLQAIKGAVHDTISFPLRGCIPDELTELGLIPFLIHKCNNILVPITDGEDHVTPSQWRREGFDERP